MPIISPKIPTGLEELMRGLAKSCIKENPANIYEFAAEYFENLLKERDGSVDQSYKKFATYKVYKKNKNARKREKENSNDVNDARVDNGFRKDGNVVNYVNPDVFGRRDSSLEEIILPESSKHMTSSPPKSQNSISSESEINAVVRKEASVDIEGPPSGNSEDDDIKNMVFDEDMAQAALKIQSTFRGHKVRREFQGTKVESAEVAEHVNEGEEQQKEADVDVRQIEYNLESAGDAEVDESGVSEEFLNGNQVDAGDVQENLQADDDDIANMVLDDEMEDAALKIQATFRGHRARREIKEADLNPPESVPTETANENEETQRDENLEKEIVDTEITEGDGINLEIPEVTENTDFEKGCVEELQIESEINGEEVNVANVEDENVCESLNDMKNSTAEAENGAEPMEEVPTGDEKVDCTEGEQEEIAEEKSNEIFVNNVEARDDLVDDVTTEVEPSGESEKGNLIEEEAAVDDDNASQEPSVPAEQEIIADEAEIETAEVEAVSEPEITKTSVEKLESVEASKESEIEGESVVVELEPEIVEASAPTESEVAGDEVLEASAAIESEIIEAFAEEEIVEASVPAEEEIAPTESEKAEDETSTLAADDEVASQLEEVDVATPENLDENELKPEENLVTELASENVDETLETEKPDLTQVSAEADEEIKDSALAEEIAIETTQTDNNAEDVSTMGDIVEEASPSDGVVDETNEAVGECLIDSIPAEEKVASGGEENIDENPQETDTLGKVESIEREIAVEEEDEDAFKRKPTIENELSLFEKVSSEEKLVPEGNEVETIDGEMLTSEENAMDEAKAPIDPKVEAVIELTDNGENVCVGEENVNEGENVEEKPQENEALDNMSVEGEDVVGNEEKPQEGLTDLANENENEIFNVVAEDDYTDATPVIEAPCEKKSIENLEDDQENIESEIAKESSLSEIGADHADQSDGGDNLEKLPSEDIEYSKLKESLSEHESVDEVDNKSRDITDEKSIDGDTPASDDHKSIDEENEQLVIENPILNAAISPIELMDEVVNEYAKAAAKEIFPTNSADGENPEILNEENPLREIESPQKIDLTQEGVSPDESEPIQDEILKPEEEVSEIPEENQAPMDENIPKVSMENGEDEENNEEREKVDPDQPKAEEVDDDIANMVLDDEMEDAALKIQAAFRGHKVRREQQNSQDESKKSEEEEAAESTVVIDQCSDDNVETQDQEETEQQDTSADVEEIQESETGDQEETQEESHDDENAEEDEAAVEEAEENDTTEQGEDDPDGTPEEQGESSEQQNNDDDDVANMVLDEEMEQAALKIQSTFRGHKTRKDIKKDEGGETATTSDEPEAPKDPVEEVDDDIANMVLDDEMEQAALKIQSTFRGHKTRKDMKKDEKADEEEKEENEEESEDKKEEEPPKEEEEAAAAPAEKSAKQLQDEEDIAGLVMDAEMEATALKIQSAFRGKKFGKRSGPKDGDETSSSAADTTGGEETQDEDTQDAFQNEEERMEFGESSYDEKVDDYATAHYSPSGGDNQYSIERFDGSNQNEPLAMKKSLDDLNLMQGGGIFPDPSGESSDILTGSSGDDRDPDRNSSYEKVPSDKSYEIDDPIMERKKSVEPSNEEKVSENFDSDENKDMAARCEAEAMYYSLKKNELLSMEKQLSGVGEQVLSTRASIEEQKHNSEEGNDDEEEEDDDDVVFGMQPSPSSAKKLKYGMSMDDRLLGSILSQDYSIKSRGYPDDGFDPMLEAAMRNHQFMEKLHGISGSDDNGNSLYQDFPDGVGDEDQFDDLYNSNSIRRKIMASSISIADSDYFDPTNNRSIIDDDKIRTALETIHSTDSESTIGSAATKIQVGERLLTRRNHSMQPYSSIGNAAIDRSLDEFIQSQELRIDKFDEEMEGYNSPPPRKQESAEEWTDDTTTYTDSDRKVPIGGIIEIKLEQKSFLTVDERRRTLHREDAIQRNSTREDEDSSKSSTASAEKLSDKKSSTVESNEGSFTQQDSFIDTEINVPVIDLTPKKTKTSSQAQMIPQRMKRQHTMPVQIQTDVIRVIPKHLRKRIKSADGDKKKRFSN